MRGHRHALTFAALLAAASIGCLSTGAAAGPRKVLELFTSQGCSSCPPADRLFAKLADDPQFIVLSLPVDYWDRLGWKDTFAKHAFTERQRAYASVRGDGQVYTPQAVVNGSEHANGANRRAIDASAETTSDLSVPVMRGTNGRRHRRFGRSANPSARRRLQPSWCCRIWARARSPSAAARTRAKS